ncbi:hypothetical protein [Brevundimonas denitrificans]|uniref:hypothetical protein n=1 Tax=Brevundimonas denitrificans TaxID=1443434 RepID=UPI00223B3AA4|nr:hypothetical protein [Brevundimonas denitrificans]
MRTLAPVLFLLLGACAALGPDPLPVCDGQARRPANPHGSVLTPPGDPGAAPAPASNPAQAITAPAPVPTPPEAAGAAGRGEADAAAADLPAGGCL